MAYAWFINNCDVLYRLGTLTFHLFTPLLFITYLRRTHSIASLSFVAAVIYELAQARKLYNT